jgi:hypothetical protein
MYELDGNQVSSRVQQVLAVFDLLLKIHELVRLRVYIYIYIHSLQEVNEANVSIVSTKTLVMLFTEDRCYFFLICEGLK